MNLMDDNDLSFLEFNTQDRELFFSLDEKLMWGELSKLEKPGFYWINTDRQIDAIQFCKQTISALRPNDLAAVVCGIANPKPLLMDIKHQSAKKIPLFSLPEKKTALLELTSDFKKALATNNRLFLLLTPAELWHVLNAEEIQLWIEQISKWFRNENSTFLVINYGPGVKTLHQQLIRLHCYLNGLTHFQWFKDSWNYVISWWATNNGLIAKKTLHIKESESQWLLPKEQSTINRNTLYFDESLYYIEKNILKDINQKSENWHLVEDNQSLAARCQLLKAATVVFALYNDNQLEELVRQVHSTRKHCGNQLKIVVREMSNNLRFSDQRLLMAAGANLIVPLAVTISKFLVMLDGIQGQIFLRHTPEQIDTWLEAMRPLKIKGYLSPNEFVSIVRTRIENTILPENGKGLFIILHPTANISAAQTLTVCNLQRMGDVMTVIDNQLYLFLSDCNINDIELTFTYIFKIPINDLFSHFEILEQDLSILSTLKQMNLSSGIVPTDVGLPLTKQKQKPSSAPPPRRIPIEFHLRTIDHKEHPDESQ